MTRLGPLLAASALLVFNAHGGAAGQQPAFSTRVESVRVDVLVLDNGRPILGLQPADFEIVDNGVPQQVDLVSFENIPLNVVLAFDMSDSVAGERLEQLQDAGRAMLGGLKTGDQAAVVTFSNVVTRAAPLSGDITLVRDALYEAWGTGATSLADGGKGGLQVVKWSVAQETTTPVAGNPFTGSGFFYLGTRVVK